MSKYLLLKDSIVTTVMRLDNYKNPPANVILSPDGEDHRGEFWDGQGFNQVEQTLTNVITVREFKSRFTSSTYRAIRDATKTHDAALQAWEVITSDSSIDLEDQTTKDNVQKFVDAGVLTQIEYDEIMV